MEFNDLSWERHVPSAAPISLTTDDVVNLRQLLSELRDLTLSRATYAAASQLLKRFGDTDDGADLVQLDVRAN